MGRGEREMGGQGQRQGVRRMGKEEQERERGGDGRMEREGGGGREREVQRERERALNAGKKNVKELHACVFYPTPRLYSSFHH